MNQENFSSPDPEKTNKEILGLPAVRKEMKQKYLPFGELSTEQKKTLAEEMEKYCERHSIPYNRLNLIKTDKAIFRPLEAVFLDALLRTGATFEKISGSVVKFRSIIARGFKLREMDFQGINNEISNWESKYNQDFKYQDYIGPLAISYKKIREIKERNQYLEPNLSAERNFYQEIKERKITFNELFNFLSDYLTKSQDISINRDFTDTDEEKAIIIRSSIFNFVKSGNPIPLIHPDAILQSDQFEADELIWRIKGKDIDKIDSQKWQQMESIIDDLYQQTINRIAPLKNEIKHSLDIKNANALSSLNRKIISKYIFIQIPEIITHPGLIQAIPEKNQLGNLWQEGKYITIDNFKIPHLDALKKAHNSIASRLPKAELAQEHPDLIRIKEAILAWTLYQKKIRLVEIKKNQLKNESGELSSRLQKLGEENGKLTKQEAEDFYIYLENHTDIDSQLLLEKFDHAKKIKRLMEINFDYINSIKKNIKMASLTEAPGVEVIKKIISKDIGQMRTRLESLQQKLQSGEYNLTQRKKVSQKILDYQTNINKKQNQIKEIEMGVSKNRLREIWKGSYSENRYHREKSILDTLEATKKHNPKKLDKYFSKEWTGAIINLLQTIFAKRVVIAKKTLSIGSIEVNSKDELFVSVKKHFKKPDIAKREFIKKILDSPFAYEIKDKITIREYLETILRTTHYANFYYNDSKIINEWQTLKSQIDIKVKEIFIKQKTEQLENIQAIIKKMEQGQTKEKLTGDFVKKMQDLNFTMENS